ncbi:hypothetical protein F441_18853 [Phytophthora nicotianae CJ01A1]|uniref:Uncharacterized protein n=4 Tax=Phytophthora nicotianae TaxID=4792 RepID=W2YCJ0_PHYNI|nr:hypothetical protein L915_18467 [Phytophthora nicotianae]ETL28232.1 hypothetical protein L916_18369 [Phytophthora nicotianae]ETL81476.1 hypothetical protein L917_18194 [Phytophthora nicotianae]ETP04383.1 hypothetical protein F441_18853 [Phytophthora nicotianae CJ01A1]ETP32492.1 hypothetical protein F442_18825 [Phytophthora nicotianae P10297]
MGRSILQHTSLFPRKTCPAAISDNFMREEFDEGQGIYLACWGDYGYATVHQLRIMVLAIDARTAMEN